jgi:hypothetical protein
MFHYVGEGINDSTARVLVNLAVTRPVQESAVVLRVILALCRQNTEPFSNLYKKFVVFSNDPPSTYESKLEIMQCITSPMNMTWILSELKAIYTNSVLLKKPQLEVGGLCN